MSFLNSLLSVGDGGNGATGPFSILTTRVAIDTITDGTASAWAMTDTSIPRIFTIGTVDKVLNRILEFVDESLGASLNNITIDTQGTELIDGVVSVLITVDGGGIRLKFDGTNWKTQP